MLSKSEIQTFLEKVHSSPLDGREVCWVALGQSWFTISELRLVGRVCWNTNKIHHVTEQGHISLFPRRTELRER